MPQSQEAFYQKISAKAAEAMGLPSGFKVFSPFPFAGMNQQASRVGMADQEFWYRENYVRIGDGNLRTLWDRGAAIYTAPAGLSIVYFYSYNIGQLNYFAVFLSDGTGVQVNTQTQAVTSLSSVPGTFYTTGSSLPMCSQWGALYLLITNNITSNSYWIWDGSILYSSGSLGPGVSISDGGSGYSSAPTVTVYGGTGTGATAQATVSNGSVVNVILTNAGTGYLPGQVVELLFTGGGTDSGSQLTATLAAGPIASLQLVAGGTGYTPGTYALTFSGGGGSSAAGTYTVDSTGGVVSMLLTAGGSGYTGSPTLAFPSGGGSGASALAILTPGNVASVAIVNGGTNYTSTPLISFSGGGGSGAAATAVLTAGVITSVTVTNKGSGYTSTPTVYVLGGGNNAATASATLMPFGVSGSSIETFQQRVWLPFPKQTGNQENGGTFLVSAPGSLTDFATSDGGVTYTSSDPFLRYQYTNIKQSNGYLYPIGDSSVDVVSNVQTSGTPTTTTFNYQNTDPQVGTSWRDTVASYSRTILFANPLGVYGLYGGSVTKISEKMDYLFTEAVPPQEGGVTPCSALANVFSKKIFLMLLTITDLYTGNPRNVMISWDEKEWFVASQSTNLTFIGTQEINSDLSAWGTDGSSLFPLFNAPSTNLTKTLSTKLFGAQTGYIMKQAMGLWVQAQDKSGAVSGSSSPGSGIEFSTTIDTEAGSYLTPNVVTFPAGIPDEPPTSFTFGMETGDVVGTNLGVTMSSNSADFSLFNLTLGYTDVTGLFGSSNLTGYQGE